MSLKNYLTLSAPLGYKEEEESKLVPFRMADLEPNTETFLARMAHFMNTTNPMNLIATNSQLLTERQKLLEYREREKNGQRLMLTQK